MDNDQKSTRLFLAVRPCEGIYNAHRQLMADNSELTGTRWVRRDNLHLTVFFIGDTDQDQRREITKLLPFVAVMIQKPIILHFDRFSLEGGRKNKPSMVWARFRVSDEFSNLTRNIRELLESWLPGHVIFKEPVPHVTLARIRSGPQPVLNSNLTCTMMLTGFELWETVRSGDGVCYNVSGKYFPHHS